MVERLFLDGVHVNRHRLPVNQAFQHPAVVDPGPAPAAIAGGQQAILGAQQASDIPVLVLEKRPLVHFSGKMAGETVNVLCVGRNPVPGRRRSRSSLRWDGSGRRIGVGGPGSVKKQPGRGGAQSQTGRGLNGLLEKLPAGNRVGL